MGSAPTCFASNGQPATAKGFYQVSDPETGDQLTVYRGYRIRFNAPRLMEMRALLSRLLAGIPDGPSGYYRLYIVERENREIEYNAWIYPDTGYVYITQAFVDACTRKQLAGILAHEIAHAEHFRRDPQSWNYDQLKRVVSNSTASYSQRETAAQALQREESDCDIFGAWLCDNVGMGLEQGEESPLEALNRLRGGVPDDNPLSTHGDLMVRDARLEDEYLQSTIRGFPPLAWVTAKWADH